jgi:BirA family transcriptional regulator, biotin operon repressor / biotin---[acetyl-CoA-carboxylase] ligase
VPSSWTDLDRPPLSAHRLQRVVAEGGRWSRLRVVESTGSTNADVAAAAREDEASGLVVVAEAQDAGRGRLDRGWESPPRSGVLMSMLVRPDLPTHVLGVVPLLVGVSVAEAVRQVGAVDAVLKWPNDVLVGGRKLGGIRVERVNDALVLGVGVNVSLRADELPVAHATSLLLAGGETDREPLVKEILRAVDRRLTAFESTAGDPRVVLDVYRQVCETIGRRVRVDLPGGATVSGTAEGVDDTGRLAVRDDDANVHALAAGDVTHVRAED